jgi:cytochrome c5
MIDTGKDRMPPSPNSPLSTTQAKLVADWINQGAKNTICEINGSGALSDTTQISSLTHLKPVLDTYCVGCHSASSTSGNVRVDTYANLKLIADNGKLYGSIAQLSGYAAMPTSGKLTDCQIKAFKLWIDQGKLNN